MRHRRHHHHRRWRECGGSLSYMSQRCRDLKRHYSPADLRNPDLRKNPKLR